MAQKIILKNEKFAGLLKTLTFDILKPFIEQNKNILMKEEITNDIFIEHFKDLSILELGGNKTLPIIRKMLINLGTKIIRSGNLKNLLSKKNNYKNVIDFLQLLLPELFTNSDFILDKIQKNKMLIMTIHKNDKKIKLECPMEIFIKNLIKTVNMFFEEHIDLLLNNYQNFWVEATLKNLLSEESKNEEHLICITDTRFENELKMAKQKTKSKVVQLIPSMNGEFWLSKCDSPTTNIVEYLMLHYLNFKSKNEIENFIKNEIHNYVNGAEEMANLLAIHSITYLNDEQPDIEECQNIRKKFLQEGKIIRPNPIVEEYLTQDNLKLFDKNDLIYITRWHDLFGIYNNAKNLLKNYKKNKLNYLFVAPSKAGKDTLISFIQQVIDKEPCNEEINNWKEHIKEFIYQTNVSLNDLKTNSKVQRQFADKYGFSLKYLIATTIDVIFEKVYHQITDNRLVLIDKTIPNFMVNQ